MSSRECFSLPQVPKLRLEGAALVPDASPEIWLTQFCQAFGLQDQDWALQLLETALHAVSSQDLGMDKAQLGNLLIAGVSELKPRDGLEAMLAMQAVVAHIVGLSFLARGNRSPLPGLAEFRLGLAERLLKLSGQHLRTLAGHRTKGQQHVRVEHVHVHDGGQAIVGAVQTGG